jgi:hypothetical protein
MRVHFLRSFAAVCSMSHCDASSIPLQGRPTCTRSCRKCNMRQVQFYAITYLDVLECHAGSQLRFTATRPEAAGCSESLHFVRLAISACLYNSSPRPTCTADSSAALTATAPVRSCACLAMFCTSATFTAAAFPSHSPPCHVQFTTRISSLAFPPHLSLYPLSLTCFPDSVVPFGTLTLSWIAFHSSVCPCGGDVGSVLFCTF